MVLLLQTTHKEVVHSFSESDILIVQVLATPLLNIEITLEGGA